ncbi:MAG: hypothetical protein MR051_05840, partial [Lentisphaeria bacterium]|nr:hypothetical protein [Lentisphaeria bacterium]
MYDKVYVDGVPGEAHYETLEAALGAVNPGGEVVVNGVTISGESVTGSDTARPDFSVSDAWFDHNYGGNAGALEVLYADATISGTTFSGNSYTGTSGDHRAGAIRINSSTVTISGSTIADNVGWRAAVFVGGDSADNRSVLTISNTTFSGNTKKDGAVICGALFIQDYADVTISDSSFLTTGDIIWTRGNLHLTGNFLYNGSGFYRRGNGTLTADGLNFISASSSGVMFDYSITNVGEGIIGLELLGSADVTFTSQDLSNLRTLKVGGGKVGSVAVNISAINPDVAVEIGGATTALDTVTAINGGKRLGVVKYASNNLSYFDSGLLTLAETASGDFIRTEFVDGYQGRTEVSGGSHTISGAVFSGNTYSGYGSAISVTGGTLTIDNCEFSGNTATRGTVHVKSLVTIKNSVFSGNGGGDHNSQDIYVESNGGQLTIEDSSFTGGIFAQARIAFRGDVSLGNGILFSYGSDFFHGDGVNLTFTNTAAKTHQAMVKDEGEGGVTGLVFNNTAKVAFSGGGTADFSDVETITVSGNMTGNIGSGFTSLNETAAVVIKGATTTLGTVSVIADGRMLGVLRYGGGNLTYGQSDTLTLADTASGDFIRTELIDGYRGRIEIIEGTRTISGMTFSGNTYSGYGSAISVTGGTVTIDNCEFVGNTATRGTVHVKSLVTIQNSVFTGNGIGEHSSEDLYVEKGGKLTIRDSSFTGGIFAQDQITFRGDVSLGNGILFSYGSDFFHGDGVNLTFTNTVAKTHQAMVKGEGEGGVTGLVFNNTAKVAFSGGGTADFSDVETITVSGNMIGDIGSGFTSLNEAAAVIFKGATTALGNAAAIGEGRRTLGAVSYGSGSLSYGESTLLTLAATASGPFTRTEFVDGYQGRVEITGGTHTISGATFADNFGSTGGAIFADANADLLLDNVVMSGNRGEDGGAFYVKGPNAVISGGTFSGNITTKIDNQAGGGGVFFIGGENSASTISVAIADAVFSGNSSGRHGGVVFDKQSSFFTASGSTFSGNTAARRGGALTLYGSAAMISGCTFSGNTACGNGSAGDAVGGAIYFQNSAGSLTIDGSDSAVVFDGNIAQDGGGALWVRQGAATLTGDIRFLTAGDSVNVRSGGTILIDDAVITLNADLTSRNDGVEAEGTLITVRDSVVAFGGGTVNVSALNIGENVGFAFTGEQVNFVSQDLSDVAITVDGSLYSGSEVIVAAGVTGIGSYDVIGDASLFLKLDGADLVMYERAADLKDGDAPVGNYKGTGDANLVTGGVVTVAFFGTTQASGNVRTVFTGGTVVNSTIGGALVLAGSSAGLGAVTLDIRDGVSLLGGPSNGGMNYVAGYAYGANASPSARDDAKCLTVDSAVLNLSGSSINGNLSAGAHARRGAWTEVTATAITVTGGIVEKLYGGGWAERYGQSDVGTATVNISGGSINRLYAGGGNGSNAYTYTTTADLTISGGTVDYVFLGGRNINCFVGDATLTITGAAQTLTRIS